ncbi:ABC transporter substrate-binding protein [Mycoplasma capricolum subsp. capripneumoniae]|uniref:ABC transporter substrate-binding protein n=1 Tax=Mycoplasma capricolum TaxID=2095 RepID=UPI001404E04F|nr:ABC transporter substrate-binding protein [Mycoplasma capricolum]QIN42142.1 ABC transporter substrate-binding protein [Mycoplasma capricolum subsp. capripneumoniae]
MKKITKFLILFTSSTALISITVPLTVINLKAKKTIRDYDLGLVAEPINSLNYIKFASVSKVLPSLVEAPLKSGPSENLKRILSIPEIPMGTYNNDVKLVESDFEKGITTIDKYFQTKEPSKNPTGRFYALDGFGNTTGTLSADKSTYHPVSILESNNKVQSANILLNDGQSRWSNNDEVVADDYIDAIHYILDLSTGSQRLTNILQRKFANAQTIVDLQNEYIRKFGVTYNNPFQYPEFKKIDNKYQYDVFNPNYKNKLYASQIEHILKNSNKYRNKKLTQQQIEQIKKEEKEVLDKLQQAVKKLGLYSGRLYWNYSNKEILSSVPYSPDFDPNADETIIMLPNLERLNPNLSVEQRKLIPQRKAVKIKKYLFTDPRQRFSKEFDELLKKSKELKNKLSVSYSENNSKTYNNEVNKAYGNTNTLSNEFIDSFNAKKYRWHRELALDEYSLRVEYSASEPTSVSNVVQDMLSTLFPINRKFVELNGGINDFGLTKERFLTTGAFNLDEVVLGPQGYLLLSKNPNYYSAPKTISNKIKIFFSSNPNINAALYDDKYIAATRIPAISQLAYWTNEEYRKYMKKTAGFGTIALAFNLDQERYETLDKNSDSGYVYDSDLRNAIYYAINRDEMLNIVGWNSSYPVITWTAFGQGSSSFGDAIEIAFDHDEMYTKVDDKKPIPVQNYKHIDHLSKSYNFEHVDRTDKGFDLNIAKKYLDLFKQKHPNVKSLTLKYISNSTDEQQNAGIALQDFMRKAFNGFINIEIKSLPENVYEYARTKGEFDLLYRNFDAFGSDAYSYIRVFFRTDGIDSKNAKTTGFRNNPSGSFTYEKYFSEIGYKLDQSGKVIIDEKHKTEAEKLRKRLRINQKLWDKVLELSFRKVKYKNNKNEVKTETLSEYIERVNSFFANQFTDDEIKERWTEQSSFGIIGALEKIIRNAAPIVPLMEVDTYWEISRVNGTNNLFTYSLQFAYDTAFPPSPKLPTDIKEGE